MTWNSIGATVGGIFLAIAGFFGVGVQHEAPLGGTVSLVFQGGTGFSSARQGELITGSADHTSTLSKLATGSAGQVLTMSAGLPSWQTPASFTDTTNSNIAFLTVGNTSSLSFERSLTATAPLLFTDGGANGAYDLGLTAGYSIPLTASQSAWELSKDGGPYLPLTGGTLTGALFGTTASFSGNVDIDGNLTVNSTNHIYLHGLQALDTQGIHLHSQNGTEIGYMGTVNTANTTWNGTMLFNGPSPDVVTGTNENFTIAPNGSGITQITGNASISSNLEVGGFASASYFFGYGGSLSLQYTSNVPNTGGLKHIQDFFNLYSAGAQSGGTITSVSLDEFAVSAGYGTIAVGPTATDDLVFMYWPASTSIKVPHDTLVYFGVDYNNGSPKVVTRTTDDFTYQDDFPLGVVVWNGTAHIYQNGRVIADAPGQLIRRFHQTLPYARDELVGGLVLGETGTRKITLTTGYLFDRSNRFTIPALNTSAAGQTFESYYYNGSAWVSSVSTSWDNLNYNDIATGLVALGTNKYANLWWYLSVDGSVTMVYGRAEYSNAAAASLGSIPATLPQALQFGSRLIARTTFQKSASTWTANDSVWNNTFSASAATNHANLNNLLFTASGHYGTANTLAGFSSTGVASESSEGKYSYLNGSRAFTGRIQGTGASFSTNFEVSGFASSSTRYGSGLSACTGTSFLQWTGGLFSCAVAGSSTFTGLDFGTIGGTQVKITSISFDANQFDLSNTASSGVVKLDWTNGPASRSATQNITGLWTFGNTGSATFAGSVNISKGLNALTFQGGGLTTCNTATKVLRYSSGNFSCGTLTTSDISYTGIFQPLDATLTALSGTGGANGLLAVIGSNSFSPRTLTGTTNQITVTNGDGVAGNPTLSIPTPFIMPGTASVTTNFETLGVASISKYLMVGSLPRLGKTIAQFASVSNDFVQVNLQNFSTGTSASADFVITRDGGTQNTQYLNLGLNGSLYRDWNYDIAGAKDGYLYMSDNDLAIGTASTAANVGLKFFTGGTRSTNKRFSIFSTGASLSVPFEFTGAASGSTLRLASVFAGGSGDYTNITGAQIKLVDTGSFGIRIPHISGHATWSTFYNYQTGKSVFWGEDTDTGTYYFRGRDVNIGNDASVSGRFEITGGGDSGMYATFTGNQRWVINNQGQCTTCLSSFAVIASGSAGANQQMFASTYTTSGSAIADSYRMLALGTGGVSLVAGNAAGVLRIYTGAVSTERARFDNIGRLGLGTTAPLQELHITSSSEGNLLRLQDSTNTCDLDPDATLTTTCTSDARLKKNIKDFNGAMDYLNGFHVREYDMINGGEHLVGVIAQELLKTHPEMVHIGSDGYYKVQEVPSWTIIRAVQELDARVTALEKGGGATIDLQAQLDNLSFMQLLKLLIMKVL